MNTPTMHFYEVGGCIRDEMLGLTTKDIDFSVEVSGLGSGTKGQTAVDRAFRYMADQLGERGFTIWQERPEFGTVRAKFPQDHPLRKIDADFVLCRQEGPYLDGRHPSFINVGTLYHDLARRDFTVNAMAREVYEDGTRGPIIDHFDGVWDLKIGRLKFVGDPMDRLRQDALRVLRAVRFKITKGLEWETDTRAALVDLDVAAMVASLPEDRRREELDKCFKWDTLATLDILCHDLPVETLQAIFSGSLRLMPTQSSTGKVNA